jgi:hypothetical protein
VTLDVLEEQPFRYFTNLATPLTFMNFGGAVAANIAANVTTSTMSTPTFEDVGNAVYKGGLVTVSVLAVAGVVDRFTSWKLPQLGNYSGKNLLKMLGLFTVTIAGYDYVVVNKKYISEKIPYRSVATAGATPAAAAARSQS